MGAGGSTAMSCSSLDLTNHQQQNNQLRQQHRYRQQVHEQRMLRYRKQQVQQQQLKSHSGQLKQANSYFDLSATGSNGRYFNDDSRRQSFVNEYSAELDYGGINQCQSPVLVLANQPPAVGLHLAGAKKSNAGVASKILQQRQQKQHQQLKKFSDSLPSLNNLVVVSAGQKQQVPRLAPTSNKLLLDSHKLSRAKQAQGSRSNNNDRRDMDLVSEIDENSHAHYHQQLSSHRLFHYKQNPHHHHSPQQNNPQNWKSQSHQQQLMKRATSLSSLHNLHNHHQHLDYQLANGGRKPTIGSSHHIAVRPESMNGSRGYHNSYDLQRKLHTDQAGLVYQTPQQQHYNQTTTTSAASASPMTKKIYKFKQLATNGHSPSRYKSKQSSKHINNQQSQQQQQGCQVLPQLPRSQSLHELIQLRSTENGQRMRTTGTLRGPLNGSETSTKVNLVAELLENRRQEKISKDHEIPECNGGSSNRDSAAILSQCSSSDDGIHDVSLGGVDQHSADGSRKVRASYKDDDFDSLSTEKVDKRLESNEQKKQENDSNILRVVHSQQNNLKQQKAFKCKPQKVVNGNVQFKSYDLSSHRSDSTSDEKINQKSTLKRSLSHSALQSEHLQANPTNYGSSGNSNGDDEDDDDDEDESDDLNELAKFLYQFKQRQELNRACQNKPSSDSKRPQQPTTADIINGANNNHEIKRSNLNAQVVTTTNPSPPSTNNLQQSPSSTTSSSGFASSTCTSNSISSDEGARLRRFSELGKQSGKHHQLDQTTPTRLSIQSDKNQSRKKYPAPPRPGEQSKINEFNENHQTPNGRETSKLLDGSNQQQNGKCLISGKLKLSSSLLSIVDEYNSTLQTQSTSGISPNVMTTDSGCGGSSNLAAVLLSPGKANTTCTRNDNGDTREAEDDVDDHSGSNECTSRNLSVSGDIEGSSGDGGHHRRQLCQLEHLKRYTQLRQMSQSELALNHLTSMPLGIIQQQRQKRPSTNATGGKSSNHQVTSNCGGGSKQPYKSKLINLIRRISDKSEPRSAKGCCDAVNTQAMVNKNSKEIHKIPIDCCSGNHNSAGGHQQDRKGPQQRELSASKNQLKPINQKELSANVHSNQQSSKILNGKYFNETNNSTANQLKSTCASNVNVNGNGNGDGNNGLGGRGGSSMGCYLSESLCDLNFDCDLELIKNCGTSVSTGSTTNEHNRAANDDELDQQQTRLASYRVNHSRSLLPTSDSAISHGYSINNNNNNNSNKSVRQQEQKAKLSKQKIKEQQKQKQRKDLAKTNAASSNSASENNWRLVPTSFSLSSSSNQSTAAASSSCNAKDQKLRHQHPSADDNSSSKDGRLVHADSKQNGSKLRWPATGWLMNGGSKNKLKQQQKLEAEKQSKANQVKRPETGCLVSKSISSSEIPRPSELAKVAGKLAGADTQALGASPKANAAILTDMQAKKANNNNIADISIEADQLLNELDQSLDRVSGYGGKQLNESREHRPPFSRKATLSWWKSTTSDDFSNHRASAFTEDDVLSRMHRHQQQVLAQTDDCYYYHQNGEDISDFSIGESSATDINLSQNYGNNDSDDDEDGGDYASLNRAMINETFGVELSRQIAAVKEDEEDSENARMSQLKDRHGRPDSPSDSFTFSIPGSPEPAPNTGREQTGECCLEQRLTGTDVISARRQVGEQDSAYDSNGDKTSGVCLQMKTRFNDNNATSHHIESNRAIISKSFNSCAFEQAQAGTCSNKIGESELRPTAMNKPANNGAGYAGSGSKASDASRCSNLAVNPTTTTAAATTTGNLNGNRNLLLPNDDTGNKSGVTNHKMARENLNSRAEQPADNNCNCNLVRHNKLEFAAAAPAPASNVNLGNNGVGETESNCNSNNRQFAQIKKHEGGGHAKATHLAYCDKTGLSSSCSMHQQPDEPSVSRKAHPVGGGERNLGDAGSCCKHALAANPSALVDQRDRKDKNIARTRQLNGVPYNGASTGIHHCNGGSTCLQDNFVSSASPTGCGCNIAGHRLAKDNSSEMGACHRQVCAAETCCSRAHFNGDVKSLQQSQVDERLPALNGDANKLCSSRDLHDNAGSIETSPPSKLGSGAAGLGPGQQVNNKLIIQRTCHCGHNSSTTADSCCKASVLTGELSSSTKVVGPMSNKNGSHPAKNGAAALFISNSVHNCEQDNTSNGNETESCHLLKQSKKQVCDFCHANDDAMGKLGHRQAIAPTSGHKICGQHQPQRHLLYSSREKCLGHLSGKINGGQLIQCDVNSDKTVDGTNGHNNQQQQPSVKISKPNKSNNNSHLNHLKLNHPVASHKTDKYNEDVKMETNCCNRDKLCCLQAKKTGHHLNDGAHPETLTDLPANGCECLMHKTKNSLPKLPGNHNHQNQHPHPHANGSECCGQTESEISRESSLSASTPDRVTGNNVLVAAKSPVRLSSPANGSGRLLQGATRLIKSKLSIMNPICRSNSELVSVHNNSGNLGKISGGAAQIIESPSSRPAYNGNHLQYGKLRGSTSSGHNGDESRTKLELNKSSKMASSQISLVNYYSGVHLNSSQLLTYSKYNDATYKVKHKPNGSRQADRDFDDNFILKRKTPNAGLKSHC